jgi:hypothetical protein
METEKNAARNPAANAADMILFRQIVGVGMRMRVIGTIMMAQIFGVKGYFSLASGMHAHRMQVQLVTIVRVGKAVYLAQCPKNEHRSDHRKQQPLRDSRPHDAGNHR